MNSLMDYHENWNKVWELFVLCNFCLFLFARWYDFYFAFYCNQILPTLKTCSFKLFQLIISDNRHAHCVVFCSMQCWIDHDTNLLDIVSTFYNTDLPISIQWSFYSRSNGWDFHFIIPIFGAYFESKLIIILFQIFCNKIVSRRSENSTFE